MKPADSMVLLVVAALLASAAALAGWIPALRATRIDPVIALATSDRGEPFIAKTDRYRY